MLVAAQHLIRIEIARGLDITKLFAFIYCAPYRKINNKLNKGCIIVVVYYKCMCFFFTVRVVSVMLVCPERVCAAVNRRHRTKGGVP